MLTIKQRAKRVFSAIKKESYLGDKILEAQDKYDEHQEMLEIYLVDLESELGHFGPSVFEFKDECLVCIWDNVSKSLLTWVVYKE
jgi:hypothetical protein